MLSSSLVVLLLAPLGISAQRQKVSTDATCGGSKGFTCLGSAWGNCCSQYGWCGSAKSYCGTGCNPNFGTCNSSPIVVSSSTRTPVASPVASQPVSKNARCGPSFGGRTCLSSQWGDCCSQYSYCGSTNDYCNAKTCQKGYGKCDGDTSPSRSSSMVTVTSRSSSSPVVSSSAVVSSSSSSSAASSSASRSSSSSSSSSSSTSSSIATSSVVSSSTSSMSSSVVSSTSASLSTSSSSSSIASSSVVSSSTISSSSSVIASSSSLSSSVASSSASPSASPSPVPGPCDSFMSWSTIETPQIGFGTVLTGEYTYRECCLACQGTIGCMYWQQQTDTTDCLVFQQEGATSSLQCPDGVQEITYSAGSPAWGVGACGSPKLQE